MGPMRSLADDLRQRSDEGLAALMTARPDLVQPPVPPDVNALAQRAGSPASVHACLRGYDQLTLHVALAAAMGPDAVGAPQLAEAVAPHVPAPDAPKRVRAAVDRLRADGLLWGPDRSLHLVGAARDALVPADRGPRLAALDPAVAAFVRDPELVRQRLDRAPRAARSALDRLLAGPVVGAVADARRTPDPARSPVDWLLDAHLLRPAGDARVVLPAEVVAILRGQPTDALEPLPLVPPVPARAEADIVQVDRGAVGAVLEHLHRTEALCRSWERDPPTRLRTGGLALRDLATAARVLGCPRAMAGLVIEVAAGAGLVCGDVREEATFLPTPTFDAWVAQPASERHARLLLAWLRMPGDAARDRPLDAPRDRALSAVVVDLRRDVLDVLSRTGAPSDGADVLDALDWWVPRRTTPDRPALVDQVLEQAAALGILVGGVLTSAGRALGGRDEPALRDALAAHLPPEVDSLVMQADLTAIVPGLPVPELAELLRGTADPESAGAAAVYRFSAASIRRALDRGMTTEGILGGLSARGAVPQALEYLVRDTARHHAPVRISRAGCVLSSDDPAQLVALAADEPALELRRISDTVLVSPHPPDVVMRRLRELGRHAVPEAGADIPAEPHRRSAAAAADLPSPEVPAALAAAAVRAIRAAERPGGHSPSGPLTPRRRPVPTQDQTDAILALRQAIAHGDQVWIGYTDPLGAATDRCVEPLELTAGYLRAMDLRTEELQSFALARITGVDPG